MKFMNNREFKIFLTFFLIYFYFIMWDGWNEDSGFALTRAIVEEKRFEIDSFANYTGDRIFYENHYYSTKFPGEPFLATPIYATFQSIYSALPSNFTNQYSEDNIIEKYYATFPYNEKIEFEYKPNPGALILISMILVTVFTSSFFSAMSTVLIYKISKYFSQEEKNRLSLTIAYGLATLIFPNALVFTGFGTSTFFIFLSFFLLFKMKNTKIESDKYFILSGLFFGFAFIIRQQLILIAIIYLIYLFSIKKEKIPLFLMGALIAIIPYLIYDYITIPKNMVNLRFSPWSQIVEQFLINPSWMLFWLLPYKGLFFYHPIFFFCFLSFYFMYKKFKVESIIFILISSILIIFSNILWLFEMPLGASFGIRFLTTLSPFLIIPFIYFIQKFGLRIAWIIIAIGIFINFLGLQNYDGPGTYGYNLWVENMELRNRISSLEINPLVDYYLPLFLEHGPRSRIFEGVLAGKVPDIRAFGQFDKFEYRNIPIYKFNGLEIQLVTKFLCLVPLFLLIFLIWKKELMNLIKSKIKWMNEKIFLLIFLLISLVLFVRIY